MARHTIGNKRGSVRGAPPDVYLPFCSFDNGEDPFAEAITLFKHFTLIVLGILAFFFMLAILVGIGILPEEMIE